MIDKEKFKELGYITSKNFYEKNLIDDLNTEFLENEESMVNTVRSKSISKNDYALDNNHVKYLKNPQVFIPNLFKLVNTKLFETIKLLMGAECFINGIELHRKAPGGSDTPPHQDNFYFCLMHGHSLTAYIPLNRQEKHNGALYVYPKSHLKDFDHLPSSSVGFSSGINYKDLENYSVDQYVLNSGDISFHHCNIVHAATENISSNDRTSIAIRFQSVLDYQSKDKLMKYLSFRDKSIRDK